MTTEEIIRDIRKHCRMAMNGVVSTSMRERGLVYKLNFGVSLSRIKDIARLYTPNKELVEKLWMEDVRELKILATLLFPIDEVNEDIANVWMAQIPNQEIREQICLNMFSKLDFADRLAKDWTGSESESVRITGYWLLARLLILKNERIDICSDMYPYIYKDIKSEDIFFRNAALLALKNLGRISIAEANHIISKISLFRNSDDVLEREIYESLKFEFDFYFE